jgi:hypothetical protein
MLSKSKGQMVALVDFARLPEGSAKPDFWSDHHEQDSPIEKEKKEKESKKEVEKGKALDKKEKLTPNVEAAENLDAELKKRFSLDVFKKLVVELENRIKEWKHDKNNFVRQTLLHGQWDWPGYLDNIKNIEEAGKLVKAAKIPEEVKDHLLKEYRSTYAQIKNLPKGKPLKLKKNNLVKESAKLGRILEAIGKTDYPSETEHLAKVHAQNLMTGKDIEAISRIDSANYSNLSDVLSLPKNFKEKGRIERLAIISNALFTGFLGNNPTAVNELIMKSNPSVVSFYNNVLKMVKLNNEQSEAIKEISKENPDWNKIESTRKKLPYDMAKETVKGNKINKVGSVESIRANREKEVKKHTNVKTTSFKKGNDFVIIQSSQGRGQPQRFLGSLLTKQSGERYPAMMREWATMLQISINPDLSEEDKKKFNLTKIVDDVLGSIIQDVNNGKIKVGDRGMTNWALTKVIRPEAGGHAGIATAGGLGTLGLAPKPTREEFNKIKEYSRRVAALKGGKQLKHVMPKAAAKLDELQEIKDKYAQERKMIVAEIKRRILSEVERQIKEKGITPLKGEEKFKVKKESIKEQILHQFRYHT